jgi:hypothetical protein
VVVGYSSSEIVLILAIRVNIGLTSAIIGGYKTGCEIGYKAGYKIGLIVASASASASAGVKGLSEGYYKTRD